MPGAIVSSAREELHGLLILMASLAHGLEQVLGRGAAPVTFRAGRAVGLRSSVTQERGDLLEALGRLDQELRNQGIVWPFEPWKPSTASSFCYEKDGKTAVKLVFRNCMVRAALFHYGHPQRESLCIMNHGLFCGYLQKLSGRRAELEILHAGENACLKELLVSEG